MEYKLRKRLLDDTNYYELDAVDKYADYLIEKDRVITLGNLLFDAEAMLAPFVCHTSLCIREKKGPGGRLVPRARGGSCCCTCYSPRVSTSEREKIDGILPEVRKRFPELDREIRAAGGYYEWDANYDRMVLKGKHGLCIFMAPERSGAGFYGCYLHAWCLENKKDPQLYKPSACVMFPIFIFELSSGNRTLVTSHTKEARNVGEDEEIFSDLDCIAPNALAKRPLYVEMKDTLVYMYGEKLWNRLDGELRKRAKARGR